MAKLTKRVVTAAKVTDKRHVVWDTELKGFGLLVLPSGVKSYVYDYRNGYGRKRRVTIGKHGEWTCEQARKKAEEHRDSLKDGIDPLGAQQAKRKALTVNELLDLYLQSPQFARKAETTKAVNKGRIERHLRPLLGKTYVGELTRRAILKAHDDIRDGKTAVTKKGTRPRGRVRVTGGATTARDTIILLKIVLNWAVAEEGIPVTENPAASIKFGPAKARDVILDGPEDYARLFKALDRLQEEGKVRAQVADAIRVIALTGARRGEIAGLRWRHVDLRAGRIEIPAEEHKTGGRTGEPRIIDLPAAAQEIIARQKAGEREDYVFRPAKGKGGVINLSQPWRLIREEADLPEGIGLHGLRHSLASHLAMSGAQAAEIMQAVGHRQLSTAQRYIHWAERQKSQLAERAASVALAGMASAAGSNEAEVVHLAPEKGARK